MPLANFAEQLASLQQQFAEFQAKLRREDVEVRAPMQQAAADPNLREYEDDDDDAIEAEMIDSSRCRWLSTIMDPAINRLITDSMNKHENYFRKLERVGRPRRSLNKTRIQNAVKLLIEAVSDDPPQ